MHVRGCVCVCDSPERVLGRIRVAYTGHVAHLHAPICTYGHMARVSALLRSRCRMLIYPASTLLLRMCWWLDKRLSSADWDPL